MNFANPLLAETTAFESYRVQPIRPSIARGRSFREGKHIAGNGRPATDERVRADANKMVHRTKRADLRPLLHLHVAAQGRRVGQNNVIADFAIMRDVRLSHNQDMAPHASHAAAFYGAAADGNELANLVVVADFKTGRFAGVGQILRRHPD